MGRRAFDFSHFLKRKRRNYALRRGAGCGLATFVVAANFFSGDDMSHAAPPGYLFVYPFVGGFFGYALPYLDIHRTFSFRHTIASVADTCQMIYRVLRRTQTREDSKAFLQRVAHRTRDPLIRERVLCEIDILHKRYDAALDRYAALLRHARGFRDALRYLPVFLLPFVTKGSQLLERAEQKVFPVDGDPLLWIEHSFQAFESGRQGEGLAVLQALASIEHPKAAELQCLYAYALSAFADSRAVRQWQRTCRTVFSRPGFATSLERLVESQHDILVVGDPQSTFRRAFVFKRNADARLLHKEYDALRFFRRVLGDSHFPSRLALVESEGMSYLVLSRERGETVGDLAGTAQGKRQLERALDFLAELHARLSKHDELVVRLHLEEQYARRLVDDRILPRITAFAGAVAGLPDALHALADSLDCGNRQVIHGDYHPHNVLAVNGLCVLDLENVTYGQRVLDLASFIENLPETVEGQGYYRDRYLQSASAAHADGGHEQQVFYYLCAALFRNVHYLGWVVNRPSPGAGSRYVHQTARLAANLTELVIAFPQERLRFEGLFRLRDALMGAAPSLQSFGAS